MKIVFVSFIDSTNIGDLLIADVLEEKLMQGHSVEKYSFNLIAEKKLDTKQGVVESRKIKLKLKGMYNDFFRQLDLIDRLHLLRMKRIVDKNKNLIIFEKSVESCDLLIVGGGNAIFDLTRHSLSAYKVNKVLSIAKKYNKKSFVTSIGIGPFKSQKQIDFTVKTLDNADFITVRDKKSFNYLESLNEKVFLSIDPVFLLKEIEVEELKETESKVVSICVIDLLLNKNNKEMYEKYITNFVSLANKLIEEKYIINLYSTEPRDYRAVKDVYNSIDNNKQVNLVSITDFEDLIALYNATDLIIGTRMHSLIIGLSQLIPVIGISWQDKVVEMFKMIDLPNDVYEINNLQQDIPNIVKSVNDKMNCKQLNEQLKIIKTENIQRFAVNKQLFSELYKEINVEKADSAK